jgi:hypothetical protein
MIWYVKEQGWHYKDLHGPFESEFAAEQFKILNSQQYSKTKTQPTQTVIAKQELV